MEVTLYDPHVREGDFRPLDIARSILTAAMDADCLAPVTKHKEYYSMDLDEIKDALHTSAIVDGRNALNTEEVKSKGF
ncbi:MAG: UDP binding domain-containing protein [Candidatus Thorarchaeota archaeon]